MLRRLLVYVDQSRLGVLGALRLGPQSFCLRDRLEPAVRVVLNAHGGRKAQMLRWINRNSRVLVVLCNFSVVVLAISALVFLLPRWVRPVGPLAPAVGSKINFSQNSLSRSRDTLYVALSAECKACERAADSYRALEQSPGAAQGATIIYLMPQDERGGKIFLDKHGLRSAARFAMSFPGTGIYGFPTIILVDRYDVVRFSHVGALSDEDRRQLATALLSCPAGAESGGRKLC